MTRADIADIALKLAGAAGGVLLVGLATSGTVGKVLVNGAGLIALAVVVLVVVYLALVFRARWGG